MSVSPVSYTVQAAPLTATYAYNTTVAAGSTNAISLGDLEQQNTTLDLTKYGTSSGAQSSSFTLAAGDTISLDSSLTSINDLTNTDIQLVDSNGNVVADNQGTTTQQQAYVQLISTGLIPGAGNYTLTATPNGSSDSQYLSLTKFQQQGTSLSASSTLTSTNPTETYTFTTGSNNIKLAFNSNTNSQTTRIQLLNSKGQVVADNRGSALQQQNFAQLTSGTGLATTGTSYTVQVSYTDGGTTSDPNVKYNFQLYSGDSYSVVDQTNVSVPAANTVTAAASVTPTSDAQVYGQTAYNTLNEKPTTGVSIGYLQQNKTSLDLYSLLTPVDNTDYFNFELQQGSNNLKLSLANITNSGDTSAVHLQVLSSSGGQVIADNQGTAAQQAAFAQLTSSTGITANPGAYVLKATYAQGTPQTAQLEYNVQLFSGTSYSALYKTTSSAQTYENAVLEGDVGSGFNPATAAAAYLNGAANGSAPDVISALQTAV